MLNFKVNLQSEALKVLNRIATMDTKPLMQNLAGSREEFTGLRQQAFMSYKMAWGGMQAIHKATSVYEAIKKAMYDNITNTVSEYTPVEAVRGFLTGSTLTSIDSRYNSNTAEAGIFANTWPTTRGSASIDMTEIIDYLEDVWNYGAKRSQMGIQDVASYRYKMIGEGTYFDLEGRVNVSWGSGGFSIKWPKSVKRILRLKDINVPSESFENKRYFLRQSKHGTKITGRNVITAKEIFRIINQSELVDIVSNYINRIIEGHNIARS